MLKQPSLFAEAVFYSPNDILHFCRKNFNIKIEFSVEGILNCLNRYNTAIFVLLSLIIKITETRADIASAIGNTYHISISGAPPRTRSENPHATGSTSTSCLKSDTMSDCKPPSIA